MLSRTSLKCNAATTTASQFLDQPFGAWSDRNPFKDHVWWHTALFALELGDYDRVLDVYDREVKVNEVGFYLDVQNAASMLMRLKLMRGRRRQPLVRCGRPCHTATG